MPKGLRNTEARGLWSFSPLLVEYRYIYIGQIALGHTKTAKAPFSICVQFLLAVLMLWMRTQWDVLPEVALPQFHACYCPLESRLLWMSESKLGRRLGIFFFKELKAVSHSSDQAKELFILVNALIGSSVLARFGTNLAMY